jgi:hypothetical protein
VLWGTCHEGVGGRCHACTQPYTPAKSHPLLTHTLPHPQLDASSLFSPPAQPGAAAPPAALATCVPQLSAFSLAEAAASLASSRLYCLLADGHVHVWRLRDDGGPPAFEVRAGFQAFRLWTHGLGTTRLLAGGLSRFNNADPRMQTPPRAAMPQLESTQTQTNQVAWTHLQREAPISLCMIDAAVLPATTASRLGLEGAPPRTASKAAGPSGSGAAGGVAAAAPCLGHSFEGAAAGARPRTASEAGAGLIRDVLVFGTARGSLIVCDASRGGRPVLQMPAFRWAADFTQSASCGAAGCRLLES